MTETNEKTSPASKNSLAWPIFFLILLLVAAVGVAGYFGYQNNLLVKKVAAPEQKEEAGQEQTAPADEPITATPTALPQGSELTSLDGTWNLYKSDDLGFSIKVPKVSIGGAPCTWETNSYRPAQGLVPVKVFEEPSGVYLAHEYRYDLTGETIDGGVHSFSGCEKVENTLAWLKSESPRTWHIVSQKVTSDADLTTFIKSQFQPACNLGEKAVSTQPGVFDVKVLGDGKEPGESECFLNYMYVLKYSPEKQKAWKWDLGQASTFYTANFASEYDTEMKNSFKVL